MWQQIGHPMPSSIPKPRYRVKAGSRYVPPGYSPPTQALRDAYERYRQLPVGQGQE